MRLYLRIAIPQKQFAHIRGISLPGLYPPTHADLILIIGISLKILCSGYTRSTQQSSSTIVLFSDIQLHMTAVYLILQANFVISKSLHKTSQQQREPKDNLQFYRTYAADREVGFSPRNEFSTYCRYTHTSKLKCRRCTRPLFRSRKAIFCSYFLPTFRWQNVGIRCQQPKGQHLKSVFADL